MRTTFHHQQHRQDCLTKPLDVFHLVPDISETLRPIDCAVPSFRSAFNEEVMCGDDKSASCALRSPLSARTQRFPVSPAVAPAPAPSRDADWFVRVNAGRKRFRRGLCKMKSPSEVALVLVSAQLVRCVTRAKSNYPLSVLSRKVRRTVFLESGPFFLIVSQTKWVIAPTWSRKACLLICAGTRKNTFAGCRLAGKIYVKEMCVYGID